MPSPITDRRALMRVAAAALEQIERLKAPEASGLVTPMMPVHPFIPPSAARTPGRTD